MKFSISKSLEGKRLDHALAALACRTRSSLQNDIEDERVTVNGKKAKKHLIVKLGDEIEIQEKMSATGVVTSEAEIIEDADEYVVINKPSGMAVHAAASVRGRTIVDFMLERYPAIVSVGEDPLRPGIVHRLDKDASGIMVVAKNQESFDSLKRQFKLRQVSKEYCILVYGSVTPREGKIVLPIARSARHSTRFVGSTAGDRDAITNYVVEKEVDGYSLVRVKPETGRTHQIRVHFYSRGYPLVGDKVYLSKKIKKQIDVRLMLHATSLVFKNLAGETVIYECPAKKDFTDVVRVLETR